MTRVNSALARTGALIVANAGLVLVGVVRLKVAAEVHGLEATAALGQLSMVQGFIAAICLLGLMTSSRVLMSDGQLSPSHRHAIAKRLLVRSLPPTALLALLSLLFAPTLARFLFADSSRTMVVLVIFAAVGSLFTVFNQALIAVHQTMGTSKQFLVLAASSSLTGACAAAYLTAADSLMWAGASFTVAPLIQSAFLLAAPRLMTSVWTSKMAPRNARFSSHYWLERLSLAIGVTTIGTDLALRSLAVRVEGLAQVALLQPAQLFAVQGFALLTGSIAQALLVEQNLKSDRSTDAFKRGPWTLAAWVASAYVLLGLSIALASSYLIPIFFSDDFIRGASILTLSLAVEPLRALAWVGGSTLLPQSMVRPWALTQVAGLVMQIGVTLSSLPTLGIWAIPLGQLAGIAACLAATLMALRPRLRQSLPIVAPILGCVMLAALAAA